ncbi:unnamed protein product [Mytilus edulis]|uniref:Uncharacterized protein n=1 Tax=Mytilus edulis TaxID=6550 RepID=A0A8S3UZV2_MYTED|nr:unnamed protein product [Mytilus edulis]
MFVNENKDDWDSHLPYVTMAYRACTHESTKCSPNLLMLGREISLPIDILTGSNQDEISSFCPNLYIEWMRDAMQRAFDKVHENLQSSFHRQKKYYDCKLKHRQFEIGNKVLRWYPPKANKKLELALYTRDDTSDAPVQEEKLTEQTLDQSIWIDYTVDNITDIQDENVHNVETKPTSPKYSSRGRQIKPPIKMEIQIFADGDFNDEDLENRIEFFYTTITMQCPIDGCNAGRFGSKAKYQRHWDEKHLYLTISYSCPEIVQVSM